MSGAIPKPKGPLLWGVLAVAGLYLLTQRRATVGATATGQRPQSYSTPTAVAERFAAGVVGLTKIVQGLQMSPTKNADGQVSIANIQGLSSADKAALFGDRGYTGAEVADTSSWYRIAIPGTELGDPVFGWGAPQKSSVDAVSVSRYGTEVDQFAAAPVYDTTTDFVRNPDAWQYA